MASFKQEDQTSLIENRYEGRKKVFLESEEDVRIFSDHWFSHKLDQLSFVSAEAGMTGGGGCQVVISKVNESNAQAVDAHGIVDRDTLLSDKKTDLFWEVDNDIFHNAQPYGDKIHVLRRWELENYLLQPDAFSAEVSRRVARAPVSTVSSESFLQQAEDIIQVTALTAYLVSNDNGSPKPAFGTNIPSSSDLANEINKYLKNKFPEKESLDIDDEVNKIKAFELSTEDSIEKWSSLSRILDGKKCLARLCYYLAESYAIKSFQPWEEIRGCLANSIASNKTIDKELVDLIDEIARPTPT